MGVLKFRLRQAEEVSNSTSVTTTTQTQSASSQLSTQSFHLPTSSSSVVVLTSPLSTLSSSTVSSSSFVSSTTSSATALSATFSASTASLTSSPVLSNLTTSTTASDSGRVSGSTSLDTMASTVTSLDTTASTLVRTTTSAVTTTTSVSTESSTTTSTAPASTASASTDLSSSSATTDDGQQSTRADFSTSTSRRTEVVVATSTSSPAQQLSPAPASQAPRSSTASSFFSPFTNVAVLSSSSSIQPFAATSTLRAATSSLAQTSTAPTASGTPNVNFLPNSDESQSKANVPMIAGITSALGVLMLALICGVIYIRHRSRKQSNAWRARLLRGRLFSTNPDPDPTSFSIVNNTSDAAHPWQSHQRNISLPIQSEPPDEAIGTLTSMNMSQPEAARLPVSVAHTGPLIDLESGYSGAGPPGGGTGMSFGVSPTNLTDPFARGPLMVDNTRRTPTPDVWDWGPNLKPIPIGRAL